MQGCQFLITTAPWARYIFAIHYASCFDTLKNLLPFNDFIFRCFRHWHKAGDFIDDDRSTALVTFFALINRNESAKTDNEDKPKSAHENDFTSLTHHSCKRFWTREGSSQPQKGTRDCTGQPCDTTL